MRRRLKWLAWGSPVLVAGAFLALALLPIRASSGHWWITRQLLQLTKQSSVAIQSSGVEAPELDDRRLILMGGGHYETGCRWCHGAPGDTRSPILHAATPAPPPLTRVVEDYRAEQLFYIVRHGIKFTGMPGWPSQEREDEVWAVVAFLTVLPELDAQAYRALVFGAESPAGVGPASAQQCVRCHGPRGNGRGRGAFPRLAGQRRAYLLKALEDYASGQRASGLMQPLAARLSKSKMLELAEWYASQAPPTEPMDAPRAELGRRIAEHGLPERRVAPCQDCHGPTRHARFEGYPLLWGQPVPYIEQQLALFARGTRGVGQQAAIMQSVNVHALRPEEVVAVANFYGNVDE